jgi:ferric-dicitrate binding protein FerR (iron transport regulator)
MPNDSGSRLVIRPKKIQTSTFRDIVIKVSITISFTFGMGGVTLFLFSRLPPSQSQPPARYAEALRSEESPRSEEDHRTRRGEERSVRLADHTWVNLSSATHIHATQSEGQMEILVPEGKALIDVAAVPSRQLVVVVDGARIEHVGTQFEVERLPTHTLVTVVDGAVRITGDAEPRNPVYVPRGTRAKIFPDGDVDLERTEAAGALFAFPDPTRSSDKVRLLDVVEPFNRGSEIRFIVVGQAREMDVIGSFRRNRDPSRLVELLKRDPNYVVTHRGGSIFVIYKRGEEPAVREPSPSR